MSCATILLLLVATTALVSAAVVPDQPLDGRIVGGSNAKITSYPYIVSLRRYGTHFCGGSILSRKIILTAAHCFEDTSSLSAYTIQYGVQTIGEDKNIIGVQKVIRHERYNHDTLNYDVALLFLKENIAYSNKAKAIQLVAKNPAVGSSVTVAGWGLLGENGSFSDRLQAVTVDVIDRKVCREAYASKDFTVSTHMICAGAKSGGKDSCQEDSGGPLVQNDEQVGIVSWGLGCGRKNYPGVYASVAKLLPWIQNIMIAYS